MPWPLLAALVGLGIGGAKGYTEERQKNIDRQKAEKLANTDMLFKLAQTDMPPDVLNRITDQAGIQKSPGFFESIYSAKQDKDMATRQEKLPGVMMEYLKVVNPEIIAQHPEMLNSVSDLATQSLHLPASAGRAVLPQIKSILQGMKDKEDPITAEKTYNANGELVYARKSGKPSETKVGLSPTDKSPYAKINPKDFTPDSLKAFEESYGKGKPNYQTLVKADKESEPFSKINPKDFTPDSLRKFMQTKNYADLVSAIKPESPFAKINPKDYTQDSVDAFVKSGDYNVLQKAEKEEPPYGKINPKDYTPDSLALFNKNHDYTVLRKAAEKVESPYAKINPKDYTPDSLAAFEKTMLTGAPSYQTLQRVDKEDTVFGKVGVQNFTPESVQAFQESIKNGNADYSLLQFNPESAKVFSTINPKEYDPTSVQQFQTSTKAPTGPDYSLLKAKEAKEGSEPASIKEFEISSGVPPTERGTLGYKKAYERFKTLGAQAYGSSRMQIMLQTPMQVYNPENGESYFVKKGDVSKNPGKYAGAEMGYKVGMKNAIFQEMTTSVGIMRDAVKNLKGDFTAVQRAQFAKLLADDSSTAFENFIGSSVGKTLTKEQVDYVTAVSNLKESAYALRGVAGMGQGSDMLRGAISRMVPSGATPTKEFALRQIQLFEIELKNLQKGLPTLGQGSSGGAISPPTKARDTSPAKLFMQGAKTKDDAKQRMMDLKKQGWSREEMLEAVKGTKWE